MQPIKTLISYYHNPEYSSVIVYPAKDEGKEVLIEGMTHTTPLICLPYTDMKKITATINDDRIDTAIKLIAKALLNSDAPRLGFQLFRREKRQLSILFVEEITGRVQGRFNGTTHGCLFSLRSHFKINNIDIKIDTSFSQEL